MEMPRARRRTMEGNCVYYDLISVCTGSCSEEATVCSQADGSNTEYAESHSECDTVSAPMLLLTCAVIRAFLCIKTGKP